MTLFHALTLEGGRHLLILARLLLWDTLLLHHRHLLLLHGRRLLGLCRTRSAVVVTSELVWLTLRGIEVGERHDVCYFLPFVCVWM